MSCRFSLRYFQILLLSEAETSWGFTMFTLSYINDHIHVFTSWISYSQTWQWMIQDQVLLLHHGSAALKPVNGLSTNTQTQFRPSDPTTRHNKSFLPHSDQNMSCCNHLYTHEHVTVNLTTCSDLLNRFDSLSFWIFGDLQHLVSKCDFESDDAVSHELRRFLLPLYTVTC